MAGTSGGAPVVWRAGDPRFLAGPGLFSGAAHDANGTGRVVGSMFNDFTGQLFAVVWDDVEADGQALPVPDGFFGAQAFAVNEAGQIGGALIGGGFGFVGARWDGPTATPITIGPLAGDVNSEVVALNEHGDAAGRSTSPGGSVQALFWSDATGVAQGLGTLAGSFSEARAVDDHGRVTGTSSAPGGVAHGFLWQDGELHDLNDLVVSSNRPFLRVSNAVAFDRAGRIAVEVEVAGTTGTSTRIGLLTPVPGAAPSR